MSVPVSVKWGKSTYEVDADTTQPPSVFKFQLYSLTGVPPERQKIMIKGGFLKDDSDWAKVALKPNQKLMMMGTADKIPEAPKESVVFMEDLPEDEQDVTGLGKYGAAFRYAGLQNLGNTCYMNSTLQCLYRIPELRDSLETVSPGPGFSSDGPKSLALAAKELFQNMQRSAEPVVPMGLLLRLRRVYPQFAQQQPPNSGIYMQQDAEECWTQLLYSLRETLQSPDDGSGNAAKDPVVQQLMGVKLHTDLRCEETEEAIQEEGTAFSLKCNITSEVNHLSEGLKLGLEDDREKTSSQLGRLALFKGSSKVTRLPPYLTVQLVRFFFKRDVQKKSKILRKVNFPLVLDCYEFCTDEYKKVLDKPREAIKAIEDKKSGIAKAERDKARKERDEKEEAAKATKKRPLQNGHASSSAAEPQKDASEVKSNQDHTADVEMKDVGEASASVVDSTSQAGQPTGRYELVAILTHKGRSADSGHYVSWTKQDDKSWIQFDDEDMIPRKEEEILELCGGGDWHMAYLLLYKEIKVPVE